MPKKISPLKKVDPVLKQMKPKITEFLFWPLAWMIMNIDLVKMENSYAIRDDRLQTGQNLIAIAVSIVSTIVMIIVTNANPQALISLTIAAIVSYGIGGVLRMGTYGHDKNLFGTIIEAVLAILWAIVVVNLFTWLIILAKSKIS